MKPGRVRVVSRLGVLVPTIALSIFLGQRGVPLGPRIIIALMFGYMLIKAFAAWSRAASDG
ncbi:MAG TPA: hypothetical protein VGI10_05285 [Polyangiaceae bacterium]|jgi:hypothetical protein